VEFIVVAGLGMVEVGDLDDKSPPDAPTAGWTVTPPKHAGSGNALRVEPAIPVADMPIMAETEIPVDLPALEDTMLEEVTRNRATTQGSQAIADQILFTTNEQRKH
jgi:hypothetical protein